jgi:hypothetical protein
VNNVSINESHWENPQVAALQKQLSELNAKYVTLLRLHQSREEEYESTLGKIRADLDSTGTARVDELQRYISHLESQLGLQPSHQTQTQDRDRDRDRGGLSAGALDTDGAPSTTADDDASAAAAAESSSVLDVQSELNNSLPFSDPGDVDVDAIVNTEEVYSYIYIM